MAIAIITPSDLRKFALQLEKTAEKILARKNKAARQVKDAKTVWKDVKYKRFSDVFDRTVKDLDRFAQRTKDYAKFLNRKAALAENYLKRK